MNETNETEKSCLCLCVCDPSACCPPRAGDERASLELLLVELLDRLRAAGAPGERRGCC